jgi:PAS domain S-box-containing protein
MPESNGTLSKTGEIFKLIFDRIQTGIIVIDPIEQIVVDINNHAEELLGIKREEIIGRTCTETTCQESICPSPDGTCPKPDLHQQFYNTEHRMMSANGELIPVLKTTAKIQFEGKVYLIESFVDIRDRKVAEDRKVALLAYLNEAFFRIRTPLELIQNSLSEIAGQVGSGTYTNEDIRSQLTIEAKNIATIVATLEDLAAKAKEDNKEIPEGYIGFLTGK